MTQTSAKSSDNARRTSQPRIRSAAAAAGGLTSISIRNWSPSINQSINSAVYFPNCRPEGVKFSASGNASTHAQTSHAYLLRYGWKYREKNTHATSSLGRHSCSLQPTSSYILDRSRLAQYNILHEDANSCKKIDRPNSCQSELSLNSSDHQISIWL